MRLILSVFLVGDTTFWEWARSIDQTTFPFVVIARNERHCCADVFLRRFLTDDIRQVVKLIAHAPGILSEYSASVYLSDTVAVVKSTKELKDMSLAEISRTIKGRTENAPQPKHIVKNIWSTTEITTGLRLILDIDVSDASLFKEWLDTHTLDASFLIILFNAEASLAQVYAAYTCPLSEVCLGVGRIADAPGIQQTTIHWPSSLKHTMPLAELRQLALSPEAMSHIELGSDPPEARRAVDALDDATTTALLRSLDLQPLYPRVEGRCFACIENMAYMAHPCEEMTYCKKCMDKHTSCPALRCICPVCRRPDTTFERLY